jgi:hypothetical protein
MLIQSARCPKLGFQVNLERLNRVKHILECGLEEIVAAFLYF